MRILSIGGAGQLGADLATAFSGHELIAPSHSELDVREEASVRAWFERSQPQAIVNLSAYHDVPSCELHPVTAFEVNALAPRLLARCCKDSGIPFFHLSTDYVFDGTKGAPYDETDRPAPLMVYGATKLAGEHLALSEHKRTFVLRTTGLFGHNPCRAKPGGRNFVENMLHLGRLKGEVSVVSDQFCCPTYTVDLASQIRAMVEDPPSPGIYHVVTPPGCSWFDFARLVFELAGMSGVRVTPVSSSAFPSPVRRPADSRLSTNRLEALRNFRMRSLKDAVREYLENRPSSNP
jgi:dTDP-4-dehydrorhamnose reductase